MKVEYINPFIISLVNTLDTMLGLKAQRGPLKLKEDSYATYDVSGVIGLAGAASGSVVLSFPSHVAIQMASRFLDEKLVTMDKNVTDAVGELANIVAGGAKKQLAEQGYTFNISVPTVIVGRQHRIFRAGDVPCVVVPFSTDAGNLTMEVSLKVNGEKV